jgi:hypothetical protein
LANGAANGAVATKAREEGEKEVLTAYLNEN